MDLTWLVLILCPYMLLYFYLWDFTNWEHKRIVIFWSIGLVIIISVYLIIDYVNPDHPPFPGLF